MSIFLSLKHNQTILLFLTPKNFHVLSKIAYVIMCIYILVQQNTILAIDFFIVRALASLPFPSPMWLIYSWYFCMFGLRCLQAVCADDAELQRVQGPTLFKTGCHNILSALLQVDLPPWTQGMGLLLFNNKNTKYSLLCSGESQNFKCAVAFTLWLH